MKIHYPVTDREISQPFGFDNTNNPKRRYFYTIFDNKHPGVDFPVPIGTEVFASFSGIVVRREFHKGMGNVVSVRNGNIVVLYAHLSKFNVNLGEIIDTGQLIGYSGDTGAACNEPHLHFELRDISKTSLKDMVFEPIFGQECDYHKDEFVYVVNNKNTQKTLGSIAELYFGNSNYWKVIADANDLVQDKDVHLIDGLALRIPNL